MTKLYCPLIECINNDSGRCKLRELHLSANTVQTVNDGKMKVWMCDRFIVSKATNDFMEQLDQLAKEK